MKQPMVIGILLIASLAGRPVLAIDLGDPAPALKVKDWVKGGPIDLKEGQGKKIYVIEFWATWCPPCRQSIPHLTEIQKKYKDKGVVIVGITDEPLDKVKPFVEKMGKEMDYVVALDDAKKTHEAYMKAFNVNGIPQAFIIDKAGAIVWSDHPMNGLDKVIEEILAGKYDVKAAKEAMKIGQLLNDYFEKITEGEPKDRQKAEQLGREILKLGRKNAELLNEFAWTILDHPRIKHRDLALALDAAKTASEASEGKDAAILDTYARALYDNGKKAEAVEYQKKAIAICKNDSAMKEALEATLKKYEKAMAQVDQEGKKKKT